jgi:4-hydroxy-tetrahydrodipicolinate synthase
MPKPKPLPEVRGVYAALATPRRANSTAVDTAAFFDYQDAILRAGVDGLVLFGSTGEFVHFDVQDRAHAASLLCKRSRVPVLVNVSHSTIDGALSLAEAAIDAQAAGLLIMPPYFYHYSDGQLLAFFDQFAELAGGRTRLFLYNLPFFTNPLSYPLVETLLLSRRYSGIKDSSGDREMCGQLQALHERHAFSWLAGNERLFRCMRFSGSEGIVSGVAAAVPELMIALDRAIMSGDPHAAIRIEQLLLEFLNWVDRFPATVAIKQAAAFRGWKLDHASFVFDEQTQSDVGAFREWLGRWLPRVLVEHGQVVSQKA